MSYTKTVGEYLSSDGRNQIQYYIFTPDCLPSAILQISHGMCEYIERYEREGFVSAMTDAGFIVCGNDHLGHGKSASENSELGFFEDYHHLVDDLHLLNGIMRRTYRSLPYILFGHSMGSFAAREYMVKYEDIDGVILCGTSAGNQPLGAAKLLASALMKLRGDHFRSKLLYRLSFGGYNKAFAKEKDVNSWLSSDPEVRKRYSEDPLCRFIFTSAAYRQLFEMLADISDGEWAGKVPLSLPVFLIAGQSDPLGENGEGIKEVYSRLENAELTELKMKLYENGRHEILNDTMSKEVCSDIADWIRTVADGVVACRGFSSFPFGKADFN